MLKLMRNFVTSWLGMAVLALAVGAMAIVFGQAGPSGGGSTEKAAVLATVGDNAITDRQYISAVDRVVARERETTPGLNNAQFLGSGGGDMVLQQMIVSQALSAFADSNGMTVSKRLVDGEIASIPAFQQNGQFNEDLFRRVIAEQNISEAELRTSIAQDLIRRQLLQPLTAGAALPAAVVEGYARMLLEQRKGEILPIPSALMKDPGTPTDAQLQAFHDAHKAEYTIPERRSFRYAEISSDKLAAKAAPSADEVRKYYDSHPGEFGGLETRDVQQIVLPDAKTARAFVAKVRAGTSFAAAAKAQGFDARDIAVGVLSRDELAKQLDEAAAKAAFRLDAGAVSDPVKSDFGERVLFVRAIHAPRVQPFAVVEKRIAAQLREARLKDLLADTVNDAEDRLDEGQSLADVAKSLGLSVVTEAPVTSDGRRYDADYQLSQVTLPMLGKVFEQSQQDGPRVVEIGSGHYAIIEVTDVVAPELVPMARIRNDVVTAWAADTRANEAKAEAERIVKRIEAGDTLAKAIAGKQLPPAETLTVRRLELAQMMGQQQQVPPPVLMLLNIPAGKAHIVAAPEGRGWFVVHVLEAKEGSEAEAKPLLNDLRQTLAQDAANEFAESFLRTVERQTKVVRRPDALKAVNRQLTGAFED